MPTADFTIQDISDIQINRSERQRSAIADSDITELAKSIAAVGLINPILITRDKQLVAGEHRLLACKQLGWSQIPAQYTDQLDPKQLHMLELEENIRRVELNWTDRVKAIEEFHETLKQENDDWSQEKTADALHMSQTQVAKALSVAAFVDTDIVKDATNVAQAHRRVERVQARKRAETLESLTGKHEQEQIEVPIIHEDFLAWKSKQKYNLLHVDFPYGVDLHRSEFNTRDGISTYEDTKDTYLTLLSHLCKETENLTFSSCHMLFWFAMPYYIETVQLLTNAGWDIQPRPFVWVKSDNKGILGNANYYPRKIYETALLCSRGKRPLVKARSNAIVAPTSREIHISEKPKEVLEYFLSMLVDDTTVMLDPTAGSGNALAVAHSLGAKNVFGLEIDETMVKQAKNHLKRDFAND